MEDQNQMMNKLPVEACMMMTILSHKESKNEKRDVHTIIFPLNDFTIYKDENSSSGVIQVFADARAQKTFISPTREYFSIVLSASTDALRTWAGDWGDLGDGHLIVTTKGVRIEKVCEEYFVFSFAEEHTDLVLPERNVQ